MSPSKYAKVKVRKLRKGVNNVDPENTLLHIKEDPSLFVWLLGYVPSYIPEKYHRLLRHIFITAYMNALFKKASQQCSVAERYQIMKKVLMYTCNVRESAGR